jgi:hypothetical protein
MIGALLPRTVNLPVQHMSTHTGRQTERARDRERQKAERGQRARTKANHFSVVCLGSPLLIEIHCSLISQLAALKTDRPGIDMRQRGPAPVYRLSGGAELPVMMLLSLTRGKAPSAPL